MIYILGLIQNGKIGYQTIDVSWDNYNPILSSDEFLTYRLKVDELNSENETVSSFYHDSTENQLHITELTPNTKHKLRVMVISKNYGSSVLSDSLELQTNAPETVTSLNILSRGHSNVDLNVVYNLDGQTGEVTNSAYTLIYNLINEVVCTIYIFLF